jgi:hypothetical protein
LLGFSVDGTWNVPTTLTFVGSVVTVRATREVLSLRRAFFEQSTCRDPKIQPNNWALRPHWHAFELVSRIFDNHNENFYGFFSYGMISQWRSECH